MAQTKAVYKYNGNVKLYHIPNMNRKQAQEAAIKKTSCRIKNVMVTRKHWSESSSINVGNEKCVKTFGDIDQKRMMAIWGSFIDCKEKRKYHEKKKYNDNVGDNEDDDNASLPETVLFEDNEEEHDNASLPETVLFED